MVPPPPPAHPDRTAREPLRPARAARATGDPIRPTREPSAPFVAGPPAPRVALAPRVLGLSEHSVPSAPRGRTRELLLTLPRAHVPALHATLAAHGGALLVLRRERWDERWDERRDERWDERSQPVPPYAARSFARPAFVAAVFGVLGACVGGASGRGEAVLPIVGRLPAPVVAAAAFGGALAAFAFALAFVLDQLVSSEASTEAHAEAVLCWARGPLTAPDVLTLGARVIAELPDGIPPDRAERTR